MQAQYRAQMLSVRVQLMLEIVCPPGRGHSMLSEQPNAVLDALIGIVPQHGDW
ncbi:MAG: hypothetical protein O7C67_16965 [Gammaproteobacteria bacterium]|nr:hypothetical protein [Gammaproteobacteria bacterium]